MPNRIWTVARLIESNVLIRSNKVPPGAPYEQVEKSIHQERDYRLLHARLVQHDNLRVCEPNGEHPITGKGASCRIQLYMWRKYRKEQGNISFYYVEYVWFAVAGSFQCYRDYSKTAKERKVDRSVKIAIISIAYRFEFNVIR